MGPGAAGRANGPGFGVLIVRLLLDSSFVIDHLRGDTAAEGRWEAVVDGGDEPFLTDVVVCEVRAGLRPADERHLLALMEPVEFVAPGPDAALTAGRWREELRARGLTLSLADALIAATAESLGAAVLTRNLRDFALTPVRLETY